MSNFKRVCIILASFGSMALFTACGNSATTVPQASQTAVCSGTTTNVNGCLQTTTVNQQGCVAGQAYSTQYQTCLPQIASCSGNYGVYNNQCVLLAGNGNQNPGSHSPYEGTCSYGLVQTSYGCLQQGQCNAGFGFGYWAGTPYCFPAVSQY